MNTPTPTNHAPVGGFCKLYGEQLLRSSVWHLPSDIRIVWITMLAMSDEHGQVLAATQGIARAAAVPLSKTRAALKRFEAPDLDSRTRDFEGRRIEKIDGGWRILNYLKYRDFRSKRQIDAAIRQDKHRQKQRDFSS